MKEISVSSVNVGNSLWGSATSISDGLLNVVPSADLVKLFLVEHSEEKLHLDAFL